MKEEEQQILSYLWHIAFTKFSGLHISYGSKLLLALLHTQLWSYLNVSFRGTLGLQTYSSHSPNKIWNCLFHAEDFPHPMIHNKLQPHNNIIPDSNSSLQHNSLLWLWGPLHKGKEEATQSKVWTARDVFGENILQWKRTAGGLNRHCYSWVLHLGPGADIFSPQPDYKVRALSKETLLVSPTPSHPSLCCSHASHLCGTPRFLQHRRQGCLRSWQCHCCPKIPGWSLLFSGISDVSSSW